MYELFAPNCEKSTVLFVFGIVLMFTTLSNPYLITILLITLFINIAIVNCLCSASCNFLGWFVVVAYIMNLLTIISMTSIPLLETDKIGK